MQVTKDKQLKYIIIIADIFSWRINFHFCIHIAYRLPWRLCRVHPEKKVSVLVEPKDPLLPSRNTSLRF